MVNAVVILGSAAFLASAAQIAAMPLEDAAANAQLAYIVSENLWGVGALFFGLWLIPMGACVLRSKAMPRTLGWILIVGGAGYLVNSFVTYLAPDLDVIAGVPVVPATIGEFWMIAYLLFRGIKQTAFGSGTVAIRHLQPPPRSSHVPLLLGRGDTERHPPSRRGVSNGFRSKESVTDYRTAMPAAGTSALVLIADVAAPTYRQQLGKA